MKKLPCDVLIGQIEALQRNYQELFSVENDLKALQGVERCLELKMKIWGLDGKNPPVDMMESCSSEITLDITKLSKQTLQEILNLTQTTRKVT